MILMRWDFHENYHLKNGKKDGTDYKIVDKAVWDRLHAQYGGAQIPRISVTVPTEDQTRPDFIVETSLRKFNIITYPRVKYSPKSL